MEATEERLAEQVGQVGEPLAGETEDRPAEQVEE